MSRHQETPWQEHSSAHHTGHMQRKEEALGDKTFSHNLMVPCVVGKGQHSTHRSDAPNGTVRVLDAARIADCRSCPLRMPCPGHGASTKKPRRVSAVLHPLPKMISEELPPSHLASPHRVLWGDWSRTQPRRAWIHWQRSHLVTVEGVSVPLPCSPPSLFLRAERAHWRLTWQQRFARNARPSTAPPVTMTVYGLSSQFAQALGLQVAVPLTA
jgi:hypothetical protein